MPRCKGEREGDRGNCQPYSSPRGFPADLARFWQVRYYDFSVWSEKKRVEKLRYIHRSPGWASPRYRSTGASLP